MSQTVYGKGLMGMLKRGWHEIPGVMGSSMVGLVGLGLMIYNYYEYERRGVFSNKYKLDYIVVRPDDPRATQPERTYPY